MPGELPLFVRDVEGNVHGIAVDVCATVRDVVAALKCIDVTTENLDLVLSNHTLDLDDDLDETGIGADDLLELVPKPVRLTWAPFSEPENACLLTEDGTCIRNENIGTGNWDAHTLPLLPLLPGGTTFRYVVQSIYEPSWTTSIGITAEGIRAGRGSDQMVQVSIGEKGVVQWENSALQGHAVEKGTILEFEVCAEPEEGGGCNSVKVNVSVYCHVDGCRVLGTSGSFVTEKQRITLSCYCYARGQGWRVVS